MPTAALIVSLFLSVAADPPAQASAPRAQAPPPSGDSRLVILGFDGGDCRIVQKLLDEGQLPNLQKLRDTGSFYPLRTTNPAQSPVSWAAFNTGMGPDTTNIYDFVCRLNVNRDTKETLPSPSAGLSLAYPVYEDADRILPAGPAIGPADPARPRLGLRTILGVRRALPLRRQVSHARDARPFVGVGGGDLGLRGVGDPLHPHPRAGAEERTAGDPILELPRREGVTTVGLAVPMVFPLPEEPLANTKILAGLGVPDARQSWGDAFILSTDKAHLDKLAG